VFLGINLLQAVDMTADHSAASVAVMFCLVVDRVNPVGVTVDECDRAETENALFCVVRQDCFGASFAGRPVDCVLNILAIIAVDRRTRRRNHMVQPMFVVTPKVNRTRAQEPAQEIHSGLDIGLKGFRGFGIGRPDPST
jgi:hypothetical protein